MQLHANPTEGGGRHLRAEQEGTAVGEDASGRVAARVLVVLAGVLALVVAMVGGQLTIPVAVVLVLAALVVGVLWVARG